MGAVGKQLFIWDSQAADKRPGSPVVYREDLLRMQVNLVTFLRVTRGMAVSKIWLGGTGNTDDALCMPLTGAFVHDVMREGDRHWETGDGPANLHGWREVLWRDSPTKTTVAEAKRQEKNRLAKEAAKGAEPRRSGRLVKP